jgi:hypothetical protein
MMEGTKTAYFADRLKRRSGRNRQATSRVMQPQRRTE